MSTMNISLPYQLRKFVDERVADAGYSTSSEYVRELIRQDRIRHAEAELAALMRESLSAGPATPADEKFFANLRKSAGRRTRTRR